MSKTIYVAGPMEGLTEEQMTGWRREFKHKLYGYGLTILDPTRRQPYHQEDSIDRARFVFKKDLKDIDESDLVFFDIRYGAGRGTGTSMEAMYAWMKMKPMITWANPGDFKHPFYQSMETIRVESLDSGIVAVKQFFEVN